MNHPLINGRFDPTQYLQSRCTAHQAVIQTVRADGAVNITADGTGLTFTYNQAGKLKQAYKNGTLVATYSYNALGQRTTKVTPSGTTVYHYDLQGHLILETTSAAVVQTTHLWRDDTPTAIIYAPNTPSNSASTEKIAYVQTDSQNTLVTVVR